MAFGPDRLSVDLNINGPGDPFVLDPVTLTTDFGPDDPPGHGEVLRGVSDDDPTRSCRSENDYSRFNGVWWPPSGVSMPGCEPFGSISPS